MKIALEILQCDYCMHGNVVHFELSLPHDLPPRWMLIARHSFPFKAETKCDDSVISFATSADTLLEHSSRTMAHVFTHPKIFLLAICVSVLVHDSACQYPSITVSDPKSCLYGIECALDHICYNHVCLALESTPYPNYCPEDSDKVCLRNQRCVKGKCKNMSDPGEACVPGSPDLCAGPSECHPKKKTCLITGFKKAAGEKCKNPSPVGQECAGFCVSTSLSGTGPGICFNGQKQGELCTSDKHCAQPSIGLKIGSEVVCNKRSKSIGVCSSVSKLIKKLGAPCNPKNDLCDSHRDLECRQKAGTRNFVCQHGTRTSEFSMFFCDPKSSLGACYQGFGLRECKAINFAQDDFIRGHDYAFYECHASETVEVPQSSICNLSADGEHYYDYYSDPPKLTCQKGFECKGVLGVHSESRSDNDPGICVKVLGAGENCSDKFKTQCKKGWRCQSAKCVRGKPNKKDKRKTHIPENGSCQMTATALPCIPGSKCVAAEGSKRGRCSYRPLPEGAVCDLRFDVVSKTFLRLQTKRT